MVKSYYSFVSRILRLFVLKSIKLISTTWTWKRMLQVKHKQWHHVNRYTKLQGQLKKHNCHQNRHHRHKPLQTMVMSVKVLCHRSYCRFNYSQFVGPSNGKKRVKASHNYGGDGKTKLHMEIGDTIQLLIPQPRDGWHYGENERSGERGWFPIQYTAKVS